MATSKVEKSVVRIHQHYHSGETALPYSPCEGGIVQGVFLTLNKKNRYRQFYRPESLS